MKDYTMPITIDMFKDSMRVIGQLNILHVATDAQLDEYKKHMKIINAYFNDYFSMPRLVIIKDESN